MISYIKSCLALLFLCLFTGVSCKKVTTVDVPLHNGEVSLLALMQQNFGYSLYLHAVHKSGLDTLFSGSGPYTVLMPDNSAFSNVGITRTGQLDSIGTDSLRQIVLYHVLPGAVPSTDIPQTINSPYVNMDGRTLYFTDDGPMIRVNGDTVLSVNTVASNGLIHVLNKPLSLLWPSVKTYLLADTNYSMFLAGLTRFGLLDQLDSSAAGGPYTVLAPLNSAFIGEGITLDSINRMDTLHFEKLLYSASFIPGTRLFYGDLNDNFFTGYSPVAFIYPSYVLYLYNGRYWEVVDPSRVRPNDGYGHTDWFLGPNNEYSVGINQQGARLVDPDHGCENGVVHGLDDILVIPDSVSIKQ